MSELTIIEDKREIHAIWFEDGDGYSKRKIIPYQEYGDMAMVTWFAVYSLDSRSDEIERRVNAAKIACVVYKLKDKK